MYSVYVKHTYINIYLAATSSWRGGRKKEDKKKSEERRAKREETDQADNRDNQCICVCHTHALD